jgi:rhodanese-related sulfurtransferase
MAIGVFDFIRVCKALLAPSQAECDVTLKNLEPSEIATMLQRSEIVLIDVREKDEYDAAHIKGAALFPLSTFDPQALPETGGKPIVFHCGIGGRSAKAVAICQQAGLAVDSHMKGGIQAWIAAGLPVER